MLPERDRSVSSLLNNMPGMTFIKDAETGVYLACNQAFAEYAHKSTPDGVVGLSDAEIFDAQTAAHFVEDDQIALSMDKSYIFFEDVLDAAGNQRQFQTTKLNYVDETGRPCLLGMCQDVTDLVCVRRENTTIREAYKEARSAAGIYTHVAHALARGYTDLYYVNMSTDEFIEFNTDDELGVLSEARRGTDFFEGCERDAKLYVHPDDQAAFVETMDHGFLTKALAHKKVHELTYRRIKDGAPFYVLMKVSRVEDDERMVVIAVSDVDELIQQRRAQKRIQEERLVYARLHALTGNFIVIYVVDPETDQYREFSATKSYTDSFAQAMEGEDFFGRVRDSARTFTYPDDRDLFLTTFTKETVMEQVESGGIFTMEYRLMMEGEPIYVQMKAAMVEEKEGHRLIVGLNNVDAESRRREKSKEIARQREIYNQIASSLAERFDTLYYIDIETSTYHEISSTNEYKQLNVPATGNDFFAESRRSIRKYVHPEDQNKAMNIHYKDVMLDNLRVRSTFSMSWRLVVNGQVKHIRHTEIMSRDKQHIVVCIENIDAEVEAELTLKASQRKSVTFTQIAERLADHYDLIYYIDCESEQYTELATKKKSGELQIHEEGPDFFATSKKNAERLIHAEDRERIQLFLDKDNLISKLEGRRQLTEDYRLVLQDGTVQFTRMSVSYSSDHSHFIICVENREEDVRREKEHLAALSMANRIARRDELTHTKNKTAYRETERELQEHMDAGDATFGIAVCDINDLKTINDTRGHKAGDDHIKASCSLICNTFRHSPVFRIGGDEFVVVLRGRDYANRARLLSSMRRRAEENVRLGEGPVVATGLAECQPNEDRSVGDVFNRADSQMYEDKARLKEQRRLQESETFRGKTNVSVITDERRVMLDTLYQAFETVSEGTYVFLCDMKFDFSRWSKNAVDTFGLPSEYMYGAGDIWENQIHPDDRAIYHKDIDELFAGNVAGHDLQYRARRVTGEYDTCTCRGVVIRDFLGEPDYFAGVIRNHSMQGHVDTLTGLRNQYGFFEDMQSFLKRNIRFNALLFGIGKFSEVNEVHGYQFGNRVLQVFGRSFIKAIGGRGHVYRIDGAMFAIISNALSLEELRDGYDRFRTDLREGLMVDGKKVPLDLHCGAVRVESPGLDTQTIYARLNAADEESKLRRQGDLVEFQGEPACPER